MLGLGVHERPKDAAFAVAMEISTQKGIATFQRTIEKVWKILIIPRDIALDVPFSLLI